MNFLADQDVYFSTIMLLKKSGQKVTRVSEVGLAAASDQDVLSYAVKKKLILITRDKDFGQLVFLERKKHNGVIFLRIDPVLINVVHSEILNVLKKHERREFINSFVVIEAGRHRFRRLD